MADVPFNPLDKRNLGESVAGALLKRPVLTLPPENAFTGAGIYAIYYAGDFGPYEPVARLNRDNRYERPIYVGKAVPPGARKGGFGLGTAPGNVLFSRLREHSRSIEQTENLQLDRFTCRYLVSDDIWIPLGESLLIERFKPLWNVLIEGFGNHPTGKRRQQQNRSRWDMVHPGRSWANLLPANPKSTEQILGMIADFFAGRNVQTISPEEAVIDEDDE
ncbi:MAG: Eco29kI family restriction endonuclease [Acidobacteriia bacterium]|nr:Eco29kI family restriction endonuclease [Terriglobia bacterium]